MNFMVLRRLVALGIFALLAGCAGVPPQIDPQSVAAIKKIGVMSLVGNEFTRRYTGLTVFGNEYEQQNITDWKVDEEYEGQMQAALTKLGRTNSVRLSYTRASFLTVNDVNGPWDAPLFRTPKWSAIEEPLKSLAAENSLDGILLVVRRESGDVLAQTNQGFRGAGIYARGIGGHTRVSVLHLVAQVALIDGKTGKPIAARMLASTQEGSINNINRIMVMTGIPAEIARSKLEQLNEKAVSEIKTSLLKLPINAWEPTFNALLNPGAKL